jgi:hypothetical protein
LPIRHGAQGRKRLGVALAAAALTALAASAQLSDAALVHRSFEAMKRALAERDEAAALALLSSGSLSEWARDRDLALHGARAEVEALPPGRRLAVLALRHAQPVFLLRDGSPPELAAAAVRAGLVDRSALDAIDLGDVARLAGNRASGLVLAAGLPSGFRAGFVRERGAWCLDLPSSLAAADRVVSQTARATGLDENVVILNLIGAASGETVGDVIWKPLL